MLKIIEDITPHPRHEAAVVDKLEFYIATVAIDRVYSNSQQLNASIQAIADVIASDDCGVENA